MKSHKELSVEKLILRKAKGRAAEAAMKLLSDKEVEALQDYANVVSIRRLHYNDHGPVHMKTVAHNALIISGLLSGAGIALSLEREEIGSAEDSNVALVTAALLHDVGMSVGRDGHQEFGTVLAVQYIDRILREIYGDKIEKIVILRSLIIECIVGHMGTRKIHSLESGIILIADGCDMQKGRARIPMILGTESKVGDIHKYSSNAVDKVLIEGGKEKPVKISVRMTESVGFFQVEEVLFPKIDASPIKEYIELYAGVNGKKMKRYL